MSLGPAAFTSFFPDRAFVVRSGESPMDGFVLTGSSTFFARLSHVRSASSMTRPRRSGSIPQPRRRERPIRRAHRPGPPAVSEREIRGQRTDLRDLSRRNQQFHCRSRPHCHSASERSALRGRDQSGVGGARKSEPDATVRIDSGQRRRIRPIRGFVFRGAQNVQALANSTTPQDPSFGIDFSTNGRNPDPPERLGWGNDGPPLRDFALVAIAQHAPTTLSRTPGVDFRVPTDEELDALVAYQLSLGRQEDFNLPSLELKSTLATNGKTLFLDSGKLFEPGHKNCNGCHFNGGGSAGMSFNDQTPGFPDIDGSPRGFNIGAGTNVNEIPLALTLGLPRDGGFGQILTVFGSFGNTDDLPPPFGHLEFEEFNSPPVVESADTGPFFHNHTVADLESAVAFYGTPAFQTIRVRTVPYR